MKKKQLIVTDPLQGATLLGVASGLKAYKLAWLINQTTTLNLAKVADLHFEPLGHAANCTTCFLFATEHCTCRLIKNRGVTGEEETVSYLVPSLKCIDFFFSVQDFTQAFDVDSFFSALKATKGVAYVTSLDLEMYQDRAHLFFN